MDWGARIRTYRKRSGLTQEALAEAFGVEARTVRRWEADQTRPPESVRLKLRMNPVMVMQRVTLAGLRATVSTSPLQTVLMDEHYFVIDASPTYAAYMANAHGPDWKSINYLQQLPPSVTALLQDAYRNAGGLPAILDGGFASALNDFVVPGSARRDGKPSVAMRGSSTRIFLADDTSVFINSTHVIPVSEVVFEKPEFTFIEEIMTET